MSDKDDNLSPALQHRGPREQNGNSVTHAKDAQDAQHAHKLLNRVKNQDREVGRREEVRRDGSKKPSEGGGRPQSAMSLAKNKKQAFSEILCEHNRRRPRSAAGQLKSMLMCPLNTVLSLLTAQSERERERERERGRDRQTESNLLYHATSLSCDSSRRRNRTASFRACAASVLT